MTVDLSAFYFDIRKDALYCEPISSVNGKACLTVLDHLFRATVTWLAFFFQAEDGIRGLYVTGVQTCALPISACRHRHELFDDDMQDKLIAAYDERRRGEDPVPPAQLARSEERRVGKEST